MIMGCACCKTCTNPDPPPEYEVFLCFHGETRGGFVSHLFKELNEAGIKTFMDNQLNIGETLSDALIDRIKSSRSTMIVYSEHFASSESCLDEVVESFRCRDKKKPVHDIFPIFYKVNPSELKQFTGKTGEYLSVRETKYARKVARWRACLKRLSDVVGWHFTKDGNESEHIRKIVQQVRRKLQGAS